ncbi:alpha/beta hydrolase [Nodosilinea sp. LEGE 07298]|uniref:alpha/beta fold hydrolase n=1 Tax=Nodosilinea sp. LEGE 07298 TaxID=2777970 RepID=UPI001880BC6D|nr:alpha/beta hydrolase [Nodosilinea sp. LEGE 07298]MBE9108670.1 alpha/beta hydrolase [Nodosilinea sp. LEGE 07298]
MNNPSADKRPFIDRGTGSPTLVFLHYFSGAAVSWSWVIEALQSEFRCVALDLPGFGQQMPLPQPSLATYSTFVTEALNALDIKQCILIGHSMGGKIALQVASSTIAQDLQQVVLIAPSPPTQEPMPEDERQRLLQNHPSPDNAATTVDSGTQQPLSEPQRSTAIQTHMRAADSAWRWWLLEGMNHSIADRLDRIQVPVTVVASEDDPVISFDTIQQEVLDLIPQAQLVKLVGLGHLTPLEDPDAVAEIIRQIAYATPAADARDRSVSVR